MTTIANFSILINYSYLIVGGALSIIYDFYKKIWLIKLMFLLFEIKFFFPNAISMLILANKNVFLKN